LFGVLGSSAVLLAGCSVGDGRGGFTQVGEGRILIRSKQSGTDLVSSVMRHAAGLRPRPGPRFSGRGLGISC